MKELIIEILSELRRINQLSPNVVSQEWNKERHFPLPSMLSRGDGHGTIISPKIDSNINKLSKLYLDFKPSLKDIYTDSEFLKIVQKAVGLSFASIDLSNNDEDNTSAILEAVNTAINNEIISFETKEYVFGCTLFLDKNKTSSISIGPVSFEHRLDWLERKKQENAISKITFRRLKKKWNGGKLKKRNIKSKDAWREQYICSAVHDAPFICNVTVENLPSETGLKKALEVARLALTGISLVWQLPSTVLDGLNLVYDRRPYRKEVVSFTSHGMVGGGGKWSQRNLHGIHLKPNDTWDKIHKEYEAIFLIYGQVLNYALNPSQQTTRREVFSTLLQSLTWFHAACREEDNLISVVKYAACLDALASGGKTNGIERLISKQLGIDNQTHLFKSVDKSVKEIVKEVYSDARSRTIHGTNDKLGHDWTTTRTQAEIISRICLIHCISSVAEDGDLIDPKNFMAERT